MKASTYKDTSARVICLIAMAWVIGVAGCGMALGATWEDATAGNNHQPDGTLPPACGDGVRDSAEVCDGSDLGGSTCHGLGYHSGTLACTAGCTFDTSGCLQVHHPAYLRKRDPGARRAAGTDHRLELALSGETTDSGDPVPETTLPAPRGPRTPWAALMRRAFGIDPKAFDLRGAEMVVVAMITDVSDTPEDPIPRGPKCR
jgi:hypothetical protein